MTTSPRTVLILLLLLTAEILFARCRPYGFYVYPTANEIPQNSVFVIEGYKLSKGIIDSLNSKYPIYLISDDQKIPLKVTENYHGMFDRAQAILKPEKNLDSDREYELRIDNLPEEQQGLLKKWDRTAKEVKEAKWRVLNLYDQEVPGFKKSPEFKENLKREFGCGPEKYSVFKTKFSNDNHVLIKTEFMDVVRRDTTIHSYFIPLTGTEDLKVGHGMCSGAFIFDRRHKYQIRFTLIDFAGYSNDQWTEWVEFEPPN